MFQAPQIRPRIQPVGSSQGYNNYAKIPSSSFQRQEFPFPRNTFSGSRPIYPTVNRNYLFQIREKSNFNKSYGAPNELVRGPRATRVKRPSSSAVEKDSLNPCVRGDHYNKPDFQVMYDQAQFFMIKSYSEDDIHKSIKYSVWASTPNGNNKLDAAFRKAEMEKIEKGIQCPIFLFFSVSYNTSSYLSVVKKVKYSLFLLKCFLSMKLPFPPHMFLIYVAQYNLKSYYNCP